MIIDGLLTALAIWSGIVVIVRGYYSRVKPGPEDWLMEGVFVVSFATLLIRAGR